MKVSWIIGVPIQWSSIFLVGFSIVNHPAIGVLPLMESPPVCWRYPKDPSWTAPGSQRSVAALQRAKVMECQLGAPKNLLCQPECLWGMKFFKLAEVGLCVLKKTCFLPCFWWILGEFWSLHLASYPVFRSVKWISKIFILMFSHEKWPQLDGYDMPFSSIFRHPKYVWLSCIHINPYQSISIACITTCHVRK